MEVEGNNAPRIYLPTYLCRSISNAVALGCWWVPITIPIRCCCRCSRRSSSTIHSSSTTRSIKKQMEQEERIYVWEQDLFDPDGQLWVITMLSILMAPLVDSFYVSPIMFPDLLEKISNKQ